jgi:hypothetical protein
MPEIRGEGKALLRMPALLLRATPREGTVREAGLASQQMIEVGAQAESAKDESAQGDRNQSLEGPGEARPSGE